MNAWIWQIRSRSELLFDQPLAWSILALLVLLAAALVAATQGAVDLPAMRLPALLFDTTNPLHSVVWNVRLPRVACGALVGMNLALAGALLQTTVRNPLADPGILGVTAGAGVGAMVVILFWPGYSMLVPWAAFLGGLGAILTIMGLAWSRAGQTGALRIVLSGVSLQAILFALIALMTFLFADRAPEFTGFMVGTLNASGWTDALRMLPPTAVGLVGIAVSLRTFDVLLLDDGAASGLGVSVVGARFGAAALAALLTASAVSTAGLVGFVGLVIPNAMRLLVGPGHRALLPISALGGAALVLTADTLARTTFAPLELPVGALLSLVGGPYFLFLLWRKLP